MPGDFAAMPYLKNLVTITIAIKEDTIAGALIGRGLQPVEGGP